MPTRGVKREYFLLLEKVDTIARNGKETSGKEISATGQPGVQPFIPVVVAETSQRIDTNQHQVVAQVRFACNLVSIFAGADIETLRALFSACKEFLE